MENKKDKFDLSGKDWFERLQNDPQFQREQLEREREREEYHRESDEAEKGLVKEINKEGIQVTSVWDLFNQDEPYAHLIPLLMRHLKYEYPEKIREGIIRALTIPEAAGIATEALVEEFKSSDTSSELRWVVGNALMVTITEDFIDEIIKLASDRSYGGARDMLPYALARYRRIRPDIEEVLERLAADPEIGKDARKAINRESPIDRN